MTITKETSQSISAKWGWGIQLVLSALLVLNGVFLFFYESSPSAFEQATGVSLSQFTQTYPTVANSIARDAQNLSILSTGLGLLALVVSWGGFRSGSRWAWNAIWVLVGLLAVLGVRGLVGGSPSVGVLFLFLTAVALVGQLLASRGLIP
jgi:hypothetical protein